MHLRTMLMLCLLALSCETHAGYDDAIGQKTYNISAMKLQYSLSCLQHHMVTPNVRHVWEDSANMKRLDGTLTVDQILNVGEAMANSYNVSQEEKRVCVWGIVRCVSPKRAGRIMQYAKANNRF